MARAREKIESPAPGAGARLPPRACGIVASPYEATASFVAGCAFGPEAIAAELEAAARTALRPGFAQVDGWTWVEAHHRSVVVPDVMRRDVGKWTRELLGAGRLPILVGGEHTVTAGALAAFDDASSLTVVQFDAHADLRQAYEGTPWNHACAMRRALDRGHPLLQVGIRSAVREEIDEVYGRGADGSRGLLVRRGPPPARLLTRSGLREGGLDDALRGVGERIYVTIDLDVLDPGCAPGVGTPEPDGLSFWELLDALERVLAGRTLAGADVVELCPARDDGRTARLAARLAAWLGTAASAVER
ncbi:MAG: arginase family protein [Deltaproteobacteria bacterium]|nr:arginase family protein [Deltaproteobacteria bacterium]